MHDQNGSVTNNQVAVDASAIVQWVADGADGRPIDCSRLAVGGDSAGGNLAAVVWFSILEGHSLHGASFTSVAQLRAHIDAFIEAYNEIVHPFAWTKTNVHQRRVKGRRISQL